jgi:hypothetical protein
MAASVDAIPSARRATPPLTLGHPYRCATAPNINATPDVGGRVSGVHACAALPAHSARTSSVRQRRAKTVAGTSAFAPNYAIRTGCAGIPIRGPKTSGASSWK